MPKVLCISGFDSSHSAGISADARACASMGIECLGVITVMTEQSHDSVMAIKPVPVHDIEDRLAAEIEKMPDALKIGLLNSPEIIDSVVEFISKIDAPVVIDPVLASSSGKALVTSGFLQAFIEKIMPLATLITPNIPEASKITGQIITDEGGMKSACLALEKMGADNVLVKGGHLDGDAVDVLLASGRFHLYHSERFAGNFRGTGCVYSTLIAGYLANGLGIVEAVRRAKKDIGNAIMSASMKGKKDFHILFDTEEKIP